MTAGADDLSTSTTAAESTVDRTLELARLIAQLCVTSNLQSQGAIECALDIARQLVHAHGYERRD